MQGMEEKPSSPFLGPARRGQRYVHSLVWPREAAGTEWWHFVGTARGCEHRLYVPPLCLGAGGSRGHQRDSECSACSSTGLSRKPEKRSNGKPREGMGAAGGERSARW